MADENSILRLYKQTNDKTEIGWTNFQSDKNIVGPNLQQVFDALHSHGLFERAQIYQQGSGWSGDLCVIHRRLFQFNNEMYEVSCNPISGGPSIANIYDVTLSSTAGCAQYLSLVIKGPYNDQVAQKLAEFDFAPKHSYLAKDDRVPFTSGQAKGLWLDDLVTFPSVMPK
jgi:hypothetical protein